MSNGGSGAVGLKLLKAIVWVVYAIATFAVIVMAFAFFLLMFDASTKAGFAQFIYNTGATFAEPFAGMIEPTTLESGGIISWSALFAIVAYSVLAWLIGLVLNSISRSIYRETRPAPQQVVVAPVAAPVQPVVPVQPVAPAPAPAPVPAAPAPAPEPEVAEAEPEASAPVEAPVAPEAEADGPVA